MLNFGLRTIVPPTERSQRPCRRDYAPRESTHLETTYYLTTVIGPSHTDLQKVYLFSNLGKTWISRHLEKVTGWPVFPCQNLNWRLFANSGTKNSLILVQKFWSGRQQLSVSEMGVAKSHCRQNLLPSCLVAQSHAHCRVLHQHALFPAVMQDLQGDVHCLLGNVKLRNVGCVRARS
jgi:hypothetical protein